MDIILTENELKEAVGQYLKPKMIHHNIDAVKLRVIKLNNKNKVEVLATLKEKLKNESNE